MTKYAELDTAILDSIQRGCDTFGALTVGATGVMADRLATATGGDRVIDRRLQSLRKRGLIRFAGLRWQLVEPAAMTDIELLPLPQAEEWEDTTAWAKRYARAVAEHNVKKRDAEIEALRGQVGAAIQTAWQQSQFREQAQARAELLAEALRDALECGNDGDWQSARQYITAALRDHDQEGKDG